MWRCETGWNTVVEEGRDGTMWDRMVWDGNQSKDAWPTHAVYTSEKLITQSAWLCYFFCQSTMTLTCKDSLRSSHI